MVCYTYIKEQSIVGWLPLFFFKKGGDMMNKKDFLILSLVIIIFLLLLIINTISSTKIKEYHLTHPMI